MSRRFTILLSFILAICLGLSACEQLPAAAEEAPSTPSFCSGEGEPDRTASWQNVTEGLHKNSDWQQYVFDSPFHLDESPSHVDSEETDEGVVNYYEQEMGSYPLLDGSVICVPMAVEFARQHLGLSDKDIFTMVNFYTTSNAYDSLIQKRENHGGYIGDYTTLQSRPVDLILVTKPSADVLALADKAGVELVITPICYDAFVFITHKDNPVDSLTIEEIRKIYAGEITNWSQVGGLDEEIVPFQREQGSGSQTAIESMVMQGMEMIAAPQIEIVSSKGAGIINAVSEYQNETCSLGYTSQYFIDTLYQNDAIKQLKIDGVEPSSINILDGTYPLLDYYYAVYRAGDEDGIPGQFTDWILSETGQESLAQAGYYVLQ